MVNFRLCRQECHRTVGHFSCALYRGTFGQFKLDGKIALVFLRHETLRHKPVHSIYSHKGDAESSKHTAWAQERFRNPAAIETVALEQTVVYRSENLVFAASAVRLQEIGTHHRAEGQGHNSGYDHRHRDRNSELAVKLAGDTSEETYGHKHGAKHQRHRDKRSRQVTHSLACRFIRRQTLLVHHPVDILDHHYRIVDHDTDGKYKTEKGHEIERETEYEHDSECANQRNRDGDKRYQCGPPALQRQKHYKNNQGKGLEQCTVDMVYRSLDICSGVERH